MVHASAGPCKPQGHSRLGGRTFIRAGIAQRRPATIVRAPRRRRRLARWQTVKLLFLFKYLRAFGPARGAGRRRLRGSAAASGLTEAQDLHHGADTL
jgi:hypothetical protein